MKSPDNIDFELMQKIAFTHIGYIKKIKTLTGGINSKVSEIKSTSGEYIIVKQYKNTSEVYKRLNAEATFLEWSNNFAFNKTPILIEKNIVDNYIVMSKIFGKKYNKSEKIDYNDIFSAIDFYKNINSHYNSIYSYYSIFAKDCFSSIDDHLNDLENRIYLLDPALIINDQLRKQSIKLKDQIFIKYNILISKIHKNRDDFKNKISTSDMKISPGDWGFHNALKRNQHDIIFLDFEYSGLDDPTKTIIDFFLQPKYPVNTKYYNLMATEMGFSLDDKVRIKFLYQLLNLKWITIICGFMDRYKLNYSAQQNELEITSKIKKSLILLERENFFELY